MNTEYQDACIYGRRRYAIEGNTLQAKGSNFGKAEFEIALDLSTLDPRFDQLWLRNPLLFPMCIIGFIGFAGFFIARDMFPSSELAPHDFIFALMSLVGIVWSLLSLRTVHAVRIKNTGGVPVLDVFEAGPKKSEFESFITELQKRIHEAKTG